MDYEENFSRIFYNPHLSEFENNKLLKILLDNDISAKDWEKYSKMSRDDYTNLVKHAFNEGDRVENEYITEFLESDNKYTGGKRKSKRRIFRKSRKTKKSIKSKPKKSRKARKY